jgi:hypothetical protein
MLALRASRRTAELTRRTALLLKFLSKRTVNAYGATDFFRPIAASAAAGVWRLAFPQFQRYQ